MPAPPHTTAPTGPITAAINPARNHPSPIAEAVSIYPDIRIIAASGITANGAVAKAAGLGVKHFLPKP